MVLLGLPVFIYFWLRIHLVVVNQRRLAAVLYTLLVILAFIPLFLRPSPLEYFFMELPLSLCLSATTAYVAQTCSGGGRKATEPWCEEKASERKH
jgi:hypothetical protein